MTYVVYATSPSAGSWTAVIEPAFTPEDAIDMALKKMPILGMFKVWAFKVNEEDGRDGSLGKKVTWR